jgi:hypothetical protein
MAAVLVAIGWVFGEEVAMWMAFGTFIGFGLTALTDS